MNERARARSVLSRLPPSARDELEKAVQELIDADIGAPTWETLYRAALIFEARSGSMRVVDGAIAHLFAAILIARAEALRLGAAGAGELAQERRGRAHELAS